MKVLEWLSMSHSLFTRWTGLPATRADFRASLIPFALLPFWWPQVCFLQVLSSSSISFVCFFNWYLLLRGDNNSESRPCNTIIQLLVVLPGDLRMWRGYHPHPSFPVKKCTHAELSSSTFPLFEPNCNHRTFHPIPHQKKIINISMIFSIYPI